MPSLTVEVTHSLYIAYRLGNTNNVKVTSSYKIISS